MKKLFINIIIFLMAFVVFAQSINVPISTQIPIIIKILAFDRNLTENSNQETVIYVLYQKFKASKQAKDELVSAFNNNKSSSKKRIVVKEIEVNSTSDLTNAIKNLKPQVIILTPLRAIDIDQISNICKSNKILSMTLVPEYLKNKITLAIDLLVDKPQININLNSSKLEGADFSSQLLKLSNIIK